MFLPNPATAHLPRELGLDPLLDLNMRLGEASGAGVAILLLRAALACHCGMATFFEAGVSGAGKLKEPCRATCR
jgi:nicotinate-nucleotide--dimethylbenzimidazole phosphoribosyltransferase